MAKRSVLIVGLEPTLIDFSDPAYAAFSRLDAAKIRSALNEDKRKLNDMGCDAELCLTDFGETAEAVVAKRLKEKPFDCVLIGAGVRTLSKNFLLFEKLINVVQRHAPQAKICFNTKPDDTAEAVQCWI